jgi:sugar/nucleoside kinase (ribokinase family)
LDLLTVGEAFEDIIFAGLPRLPRLSEELRVRSLSRHPGGGAIITAIAAARLGLRVSTISAVSSWNASMLRGERIALVNLRRPSEPGAVTVALSTRRDRAFVTYEGVNRVLEPRLLAAARRVTRLARHVHFALAPRRCRAWVPIVQRLRTRGTTTSWDFGWHAQLLTDAGLPALLGALDWVFVNEREATLYTRTRTLGGARRAWGTLARGVVIKRGPRGAIVLAGGRNVNVTTRKLTAVDTTGAGDSFNAGFIVGLLANASPAVSANLGNYLGGRSVGATGGVDGLPRQSDLPAWARRIVAKA